MYGQIRVFVRHLGEYFAYRYRDCQLLAAFAHERLLPGLAGLNFAADKFPQQAARLMRRALADHEPHPIPDQRGNYFGHAFLPSFVVFVFQYKGILRAPQAAACRPLARRGKNDIIEP